ncbi:MAG: hypothetical protein JXA28_07915, partial [Bacteroidetes bacterium]|nr:hypothetical protein [Bacteroidota bacterium]
MKKAFHISMVALLLAAVTGVTVNTHYCGGVARYSAVAVDAQHESCCGGMMAACPSCEDHVSSNVVDEQVTVTANADGLSVLPAATAVIPHDGSTIACVESQFPQQHPDALGPPGPSGGDAIPILIQSFL